MTEGMGITACDSTEWLGHRGTVGRVVFGDLHFLDAAMNPCPTRTIGTIWFSLESSFGYFNDKARTAEVLSADGTMGRTGDVGYVDEDGYRYLTDRSTFMIISGGVNISRRSARTCPSPIPRSPMPRCLACRMPTWGKRSRRLCSLWSAGPLDRKPKLN